MQTNNPTPESLIEGISKKSTVTITQDSNENITQKIRVLSVKYKVYTMVILLVIAVFYGTIMTSYARYKSRIVEIETADQTILRNIAKSTQYDKDISLLDTIKTNLPTIVECINQETNCGSLDESITQNISTIKSYLQLNNLESAKMEVNEKIILKNINEFLAQENPFGTERIYNGNITSIIIGDAVETKENLKTFGLKLGMTFKNKDDLLTFIQNIENHIFYNQENINNPLEYSALYKIEGMDYDVVNYQEEQEITISLKGFYYVE